MASAPAASSVEQQLSDPKDVGDLHQYGYAQSLRRTMGPFASFSVAFSMVSITTAIFFLLPSLFATSGAAGVCLAAVRGRRVLGRVGVFASGSAHPDHRLRLSVEQPADQPAVRLVHRIHGVARVHGGYRRDRGRAGDCVRRRHLAAPNSRRHRAARRGHDGRRRGDQHRQHPAGERGEQRRGVLRDRRLGRGRAAAAGRVGLLPPPGGLPHPRRHRAHQPQLAVVRVRPRRAAAHVLLHRVGRCRRLGRGDARPAGRHAVRDDARQPGLDGAPAL